MTDTTELRAAFEAEVRAQLDPGRAASYLARDDGQKQYHGFALCLAWHCWQAAHASARNVPETPKEDLAQNWAGMDGATAFHLIERHADGWGDVGHMMEQWRAANASANQQHEGLRKDAERYAFIRDNCETDKHFDHTISDSFGGDYYEFRVPFKRASIWTAEPLDSAVDAALSVAGDKT